MNRQTFKYYNIERGEGGVERIYAICDFFSVIIQKKDIQISACTLRLTQLVV